MDAQNEGSPVEQSFHAERSPKCPGCGEQGIKFAARFTAAVCGACGCIYAVPQQESEWRVRDAATACSHENLEFIGRTESSEACFDCTCCGFRFVAAGGLTDGMHLKVVSSQKDKYQ